MRSFFVVVDNVNIIKYFFQVIKRKKILKLLLTQSHYNIAYYIQVTTDKKKVLLFTAAV